jgi:hypothetical protein
MKRQYLGDSKDSFKWDYHDYLTASMVYPKLKILLMLTPDDESNDGKTHPELFPARRAVLSFCHGLRENRNIQFIRQLPVATGSTYEIELHKEETYITAINRRQYFSDLSPDTRQVLFLDPDNGFEPETSYNEKHVLYSEVANLIDQTSPETVISIFQHFRRKSFDKDFTRIKERLPKGYATAVCWHSLMFVVISRTKEIIDEVVSINQRYSRDYPVRILK